jgi:hypothetical protein
MSKIILKMEAGDIPKGTVVRKPQGVKRFRLQHNLTIYSAGGTRVIPRGDGVYLIGGDGNINEISNSKLMCIDFDNFRYLQSWIKDHFEEEA